MSEHQDSDSTEEPVTIEEACCLVARMARENHRLTAEVERLTKERDEAKAISAKVSAVWTRLKDFVIGESPTEMSRWRECLTKNANAGKAERVYVVQDYVAKLWSEICKTTKDRDRLAAELAEAKSNLAFADEKLGQLQDFIRVDMAKAVEEAFREGWERMDRKCPVCLNRCWLASNARRQLEGGR